MSAYKAEERRSKILDYLDNKNPITGSKLGELLNVSRQVVVQDIAILRAKGHEIIATPQGYLNSSKTGEPKTYRFTIAAKHNKATIRKELEIIVDLGGKIIDVIVEHPIYGELSGYLMINSRRDIEKFINSLKETNAEPLSLLTGGLHLHTIETSTREEGEEIITNLKKKGFLVDEE